jgi:histidine ammonia-lyase
VRAAPEALAGLAASRRVVETAVGRGETLYGINTGFGKLARREEERPSDREHAARPRDRLAAPAH